MPGIDLTQLPKTDPLDLYRWRDGLYAVDLLIAAVVWLDFFSWLAKQPADPPAIRRELGLAARPLDVMLTLFAALDLVRANDGVFEVTDRAREHLIKSSPFFLGPYYASLKDRPICKDFVEVLRTGRPANWGGSKREKEWAQAMEEETFANEFTAAMDSRGVYLGQALAKVLDCRNYRRLLDIAGGSGIYPCALVARHPHLSATVFERKPVDQVAQRHLTKRGFADRVGVVTGDMFSDELPEGYDLHLYSNVLHDWDEPAVESLLRKSFRSLLPGGLLVIHDMHLNGDKTGPLAVAQYSCILMHSTEGRCYGVGELREKLIEIGYDQVCYAPTAADRSVVTAAKPGVGRK